MTRVLVVDDKEENVYYLTALLRGHGWEVVAARHGAEALAKARMEPPDLVISDLLMPVMDGYTLLRQWKRDDRLGSIPFIVYTATYTEPADEQLALSLGADGFILKPAEPEDFMARVRDVQARGVARLADVADVPSEELLLKQYSETLIHKLEQKSLQLEESNRRLLADIVAREAAEHALRDSEERLRQMAENIDDVFWLTDLGGTRFHYVSPAYDSIWGQSRELLQAAPESWLNAVHPEDQGRLRASLPRQRGGGWDETFRVVHPDGGHRWIRARAYPVRDEAGAVYRLAGVFRDITEYRQLEEQFRRAQKMEALGQLAGGVAHDFNNLLSIILTYTSLTMDVLAPDSPLQSDLMEVRRAGDRATDLTRQLLSLGRNQLVQPKAVELEQVVSEMEKLLRRTLGADIDLCLMPSQLPGRVLTEPGHIEQIVMNLAVNARDAMPEGGRLTVETGSVQVDANVPGLEPGPYLFLSIADTGVGMESAVCERIFEPFFTTKDPGRGTGLGLSTVFGIVKQSKGHIAVDSAPGRGTKFTIYLPRTERAAESATPPAQEPLTLRGSETILLVEDDEQVRNTSRAILLRNGYTVLDAPNGGEAFIVSERYGAHIHLLIADVVLPRMSGPEVAQRLRATRSDLRVLYLSGYPESANVAGESFLPKPITPPGLLRKVKEALTAAR